MRSISFIQLPKHRRLDCAIFTTGGQLIQLSLKKLYGSPDDSPDVLPLFPNGAVSARVTCIPGTSFRLLNDWRIMVSSGLALAPINKAVSTLYGRRWAGNIVILKYRRDDRREIVNVAASDIDMITTIVGM